MYACVRWEERRAPRRAKRAEKEAGEGERIQTTMSVRPVDTESQREAKDDPDDGGGDDEEEEGKGAERRSEDGR